MNIVISNPKTGKAYSKKTETPVFVGSKIGDEVSLDVVGLSGYKVKIVGGSDKQGFPMKPTLSGTARKRILLSKGTGFNPKSKGIRKRISVRGNEITEDISQLNVIITKMGDADIDVLLGKKNEAGTEEKTEERKAEKTKPAEDKKEKKTEERKEDKKKEKAEAKEDAEPKEKAEAKEEK